MRTEAHRRLATLAALAGAPWLLACGEETPAATAPEVRVNGVAWNDSQLREFEQRYGVPPAAGAWWYDARSGMFGAEGGPAAGFMFPGHDFGALSPDASAGDSQVLVNGRRLPASEVAALAALVGGTVQPGRYWLDAQLNWGYEGTPAAAGNLLVLAMMQRGSGGGGDNNWSSLLGSGNWDSGGARGYVSIPGVGPIASHGFD